MKFARRVCWIALISAVAMSAADAPYFGKWKVNSSKSKIQDVTTIEKLPSGDYRFDGSGFVYTFRLDGKEYPMPDGGTTSWKAVNDNTWEVTNRDNGKVNVRYKLTANGDVVTAIATIPRADGKDITQTSTMKRLSGGPGFLGKWQATHADIGEAWLEITPDGADGLKIAAPNSLCVAKFDGKPYPMSGSTDGPKQTMSFRKMGAASFEAITYVAGKPFVKDVYTASADGKMLTDTGTPVATEKPNKIVFERQ